MAVKGVNALLDKLGKMGGSVNKSIRQGVHATAQQVRTHAVKSIQAQSQGETVTRYSQGGNAYDHTASKAGEAPNTDTGSLVKSIAVEQPNDLRAEVGSGLDYALFLELGTTKMQPRPWLLPALEANKGNLMANIEKAAMRLINERK